MSNTFAPKPGDRNIRVPRLKPSIVEVSQETRRGSYSISVTRLLHGFGVMILVGTLLLMLPISSQTGSATPLVNALFTATSAVCVTGLVVVDTATYFSLFGQMVIALLIQLGGFGYMTSATMFLLALRRKIRFSDRLLIADSMGIKRPGGVVRLVRRIALFTLIVEGIGAIILFSHFITTNPTGTAVWKSIFHSISAFNNAGFDLEGKFQSLLGYQTDVTVVLTIAFLIILGGLGYTVLQNVAVTRRWSRLQLDTKLVIGVTGTLLAFGTMALLLTEFDNSSTIGSLPLPYKFLNAFFHAVTPRTAGFATVDVGKMIPVSLVITIMLMFIGGASGSTAGGIKVNTFGLLVATIISTIRGNERPMAFGKEFRTSDIYQALTLIILSVGLIAVVVLLMTFTENFDFIRIVFEIVSAFGTVGLSTGITPELSTAGRLIITVTMFLGRVGPLTTAFSIAQSRHVRAYRYSSESVRIG